MSRSKTEYTNLENILKHLISLQSLEDLTDSDYLYKLLLQLEPEIHSVSKTDHLNLKESSCYGIEYSNHLEIYNVIKVFFEKTPEKHRFTDTFKSIQININNFLQKDAEALLKYAQTLLVLLSISSNRDNFLDKVSTFSEDYLHNYFTILENFLAFEDNSSSFSKTTSRIELITKQNTRKEQYDIEKEILKKQLGDQEHENLVNKLKIEELQEKLLEIEIKYKEVQRENSILKTNNSSNQNYDTAYGDAMTITNLKNELLQKEIEIGEIYRDSELANKRLIEEIKKLNEIIENNDEKIANYKNLQIEFEKMKMKLKEQSIMKNKFSDYEDIVRASEEKNRKIENLLKEQEKTVKEYEKLSNEINSYKERIKSLEHEKRKLEYEIQDLKKDQTRYDNIRKSISLSYNKRGTLNYTQGNINNTSDITSFHLGQGAFPLDKVLEKINESVLEDKKEENNDEEINEELLILEKENEELENEITELNRQIKEQMDEIENLNKERNLQNIKINELSSSLNKALTEIDRIALEKDKMELNKQKNDLEYQKHSLEIEKVESDKKRIEEDLKDLKFKNDSLLLEKQNLKKEVESCKTLLKTKSNQIDKILSEKQNLINDYQNLQISYQKLKKSESFINTNKTDNTRAPSSTNTGTTSTRSSKLGATIIATKPLIKNNSDDEIVTIKAELNKLKKQITLKDENIRQLNEEKNYLQQQIASHLEKQEEYATCKRNFEELKMKVNQEHDLLSSGLYDLAIQFIQFKNEIIKNVQPELLGNNKESTINK